MEVISQDLRFLCEIAFDSNRFEVVCTELTSSSIIHDRLFDIFMTVDDGNNGYAQGGLRKAKVILACHYLLNEAEEYSR